MRYCVAVMLPFVNAAIVSPVDMRILQASPFLFFFPSIVFSAWNGGYISGIVTTLLSTVLIHYFYIPPAHTINFFEKAGTVQLLLFAAEGVMISLLIHIGKRQDNLLDYIQREKELKIRIDTLEKENTHWKTQLRARDEFLSIASHELKTPLTSMLLQTQHALHNIRHVSLAHFSIENLLKMLETVENQMWRLSKMINDLLNISLLSTGNLQLEYESMVLNDAIKGVIAEFSPRLEKGNYTVKFVENEQITGSWDKVRIEQAVSNLISNAIKYGDGKPIEITIKKHHSYAHVIIKDHGIGIPKNIQKKIFQLFERGASPEYKGLGVGLFITEQIVKTHGGSILLSSSLQNGSTFIMQLPITLPKYLALSPKKH